MADMCGDNRFEIIEAAKRNLIEATNIETSPEEMAVLDDILFRMWQMDWLPRHAHWEPTILPTLQVDWLRCSLCKEDAIQTPFDIPARTEFCPFCGAKMDEVVEDG